MADASIESVEQCAAQVERAREATRTAERALREECRAAVAAGASVVAVTRAAGLGSRVTMYRWLQEDPQA